MTRKPHVGRLSSRGSSVGPSETESTAPRIEPPFSMIRRTCAYPRTRIARPETSLTVGGFEPHQSTRPAKNSRESLFSFACIRRSERTIPHAHAPSESWKPQNWPGFMLAVDLGTNGYISLRSTAQPPAYFAATAAFTRSTKLRGSRLAPPMRPPSMSFWARSSGALAGFIEPP